MSHNSPHSPHPEAGGEREFTGITPSSPTSGPLLNKEGQTRQSPNSLYTAADFDTSPFVVFYEVTRACDLACKHCRACAQPKSHPQELNNQQSRTLIDQFASFPKKPVFVFTGGDPMKRVDIMELISYSVDKGMAVAMTPSATDLVTDNAIEQMKDAGLSRLALSIDSIDPKLHDSFRGVDGSYNRTIHILNKAAATGIPIQVNTTVTALNLHQIDAMADMFATMGVSLWSVFFLIPVGRGQVLPRIQPEDYEVVFEKLWDQALKQPYAIKTTEAHHYRRYVLQKQGDPQKQPGNKQMPGRIQRAPIGVNDGKGVMFVSHTGSVYPSGFMPIRCGKFPEESIVDVYCNSQIFKDLRSPDLLKGKCGSCEYRSICGGSRARAYAVTKDHLGSEPDCVYIPKAMRS